MHFCRPEQVLLRSCCRIHRKVTCQQSERLYRNKVSTLTTAHIPLDLAFANRSLREICESQLIAERKLGLAEAKNLRARISDIEDANSMQDVVAGPPRILDSSPPGCVEIPIGENVVLQMCANHVKVPVTETGEVNWSVVTRYKVLMIGRPNG
jgi:hypothetical protein